MGLSPMGDPQATTRVSILLVGFNTTTRVSIAGRMVSKGKLSQYHPKKNLNLRLVKYDKLLVVWNMLFKPLSWECHHPN